MGLCNVWRISSQNRENHVLAHTPDWTNIYFCCLVYYHANTLVAIAYYLQVWGQNTEVWCDSSEGCVQMRVV